MTDVRKLLARLNPATPNYAGGRGGLPELTAQDIAAAVGMIPQGLGREVLLRLWWPDGARLSERELNLTVASAMRSEMQARLTAHQIARLELHIARENWADKRHRTEHDRVEMLRLEGRADYARAVLWPMQPEMHVKLREAVLSELSAPNHCRTCRGRGSLHADALVIVCSACNGAGSMKTSDVQRAERIGRDESSYRATWKPVYEWVYRLLADAEGKAAADLREALKQAA